MAQRDPTAPKSPRDVLGGVRAGGLEEDSTPRLWGVPLKYISLVTLAVQNALLAIIMHYSRVSTAPSRTYSAASAVLLNELLKGLISLAVAFSRVDEHGTRSPQPLHRRGPSQTPGGFWSHPHVFASRCRRLGKEVFSPDCWKLSIPAILYVIQNNLQFVAASNLEAATFQVTYQMKILTTAGFSVLMLRKKLNSTKWIALCALAIGVGIVQIQSGSGKSHHDNSVHVMYPFKGFMAVTAACFTSGLAGVYFEMVLKGSQTDLWVRNVQLSLFSLLPALVPVFASQSGSDTQGPWFWSLFANFGAWAWATVAIQVLGGLVTAIVIKYSDNILKGFATSLSIVISFLASVALFHFHITPSFVIGSSTVLAATWMYNRPECRGGDASGTVAGVSVPLPKLVAGVITPRKSSYPGTPVEADAPILGETGDEKRRLSLGGGASPHLLTAALKLVTPRSSMENLAGHNETLDLDDAGAGAYGNGLGLSRSASASTLALSGYQSPYLSRSHSPAPGALSIPSRPPSGRVLSGSQLTVPLARSSSGQLYHHANGSNGSVISLNDSPTPSR